MWLVYVRPDGAADFLPAHVETEYKILVSGVSLSEAIRVSDNHNALRMK